DMLPIARDELRRRTSHDGAVVRRNVLRIVSTALPGVDTLATLLIAKDDPSEHVRQGLAVALATLRDPASIEALSALCLEDSSPRVRGVANRELAKAALSVEHARGAARAVVTGALVEADPLVARV